MKFYGFKLDKKKHSTLIRHRSLCSYTWNANRKEISVNKHGFIG